MVHFFISMFFTICVLAACQKQAEEPHDRLKPSTSHRSVKEKTIIVPPEVLQRWKGVKLAIIDKVHGTENIYIVPIGTPFKIPSSSLSITVKEFLPAFTIEGSTITTSSNDLLNPGANVRISENGGIIFNGWLFYKFPNTHAITHPKYGVSMIGVVPRQ